MSAWKLPLVVAALVLPIVAGFMAGGPALGVAIGALAVLALLVVAARMRPRGPIGEPAGKDSRRRVLLVATCPVEDPAAVRRVAADARLGGGVEPAQVRVLAPASIGFLDRWASDVEGARRDAQECLVATVAALAKAGVDAEARVGDEDIVQAVEDQLGSYPATEVILVSDGEGEGDAPAAAAELRDRLRPEFREVHSLRLRTRPRAPAAARPPAPRSRAEAGRATGRAAPHPSRRPIPAKVALDWEATRWT